MRPHAGSPSWRHERASAWRTRAVRRASSPRDRAARAPVPVRSTRFTAGGRPPDEVRRSGLGRRRGVLRGPAGHRGVGRAPAPADRRRLLPRGPARGLVRDRGVALRLEHRLRARGRPRRLGGQHRHGAGALRAALVDHPPPRLGVRAVLPAQRRVHDARVPRAPLRRPQPLVPVGGHAGGLRPHQGVGHRVRGRRDAAGADGPRLLDGGGGGGGADRRLHRPRRPAGGGLHRGAAGVRPRRRLGRRHRLRARGDRRLGRAAAVGGGRAVRHVEAPRPPRVPVARHAADPAHRRPLVLVHRPVHRAAGAGRRGRGDGAAEGPSGARG